MSFQSERTMRGDPKFMERLEAEKERAALGEVEEVILGFDKTPKSLKEELDKYVIGQEKGKKVLSIEVFFHYKRIQEALKEEMTANGGDFKKALEAIETPKANILLIGPSGCGKTYTLEVASKILRIPFVKEDMTSFTEAGYVGRDVNEIILDLLKEANWNAYLAQLGVVLLDELDKKFNSNFVGRDVSGAGVQNALLKMIEGKEVYVNNHKFKTDKLLFVGSGAFEGLESIVRRDLKTGLYQAGELVDWTRHVTNEHLVAYGMERQLLGRLPVKVFYHSLSKQDLVDIMMKSEDSPLHRYKNDLRLVGIELEVEEDAFYLIADKAVREGIGARGLTSILNSLLEQERYELPSEGYKGRVTLTKETVKERLEEERI